MSNSKRDRELATSQRITEAEIGRQRQLQDFFQNLLTQQLGSREDILNPLFGNAQDLIDQLSALSSSPVDVQPGEGYTPEELAALKANAVEGGGFDAQAAQLKAALGARGLYGGRSPVGGAAIPAFSQLASARAQSRANALRDVILGNASLTRDQFEKNRAFALANRGYALQGLTGALGGANQLTGLGLQRTDFTPFISGVLGANQGITSLTATRAGQVPAEKTPWWQTALGAGIGAAGAIGAAAV